MRDLGIVVMSVIIAVILEKTGAIKGVLVGVEEYTILASFIAGIFFVSVFTVVPATVVIIEALELNPILEVAFFAALGALVGDLLIFRFLRDNFSHSLLDFIMNRKRHKFVLFFQKKIFRLLGPILGAIIIISPFPDEIGLMMMGFSGIKTKIFIPISFTFNFIGILIIGLLVK